MASIASPVTDARRIDASGVTGCRAVDVNGQLAEVRGATADRRRRRYAEPICAVDVASGHGVD
jgi:hypothetical protein